MVIGRGEQEVARVDRHTSTNTIVYLHVLNWDGFVLMLLGNQILNVLHFNQWEVEV